MKSPTANRRVRPIIRVFVSSTFSDLKLERNALQKTAFPSLERRCPREGFQFQAIDLRLGEFLPKQVSIIAEWGPVWTSYIALRKCLQSPTFSSCLAIDTGGSHFRRRGLNRNLESLKKWRKPIGSTSMF